MRNPSASTNFSTKAAPGAASSCCSATVLSFSNVADLRQHLLAEQFQGAHQRIDVAVARRLQQNVDDAGAHDLLALFDLLDDRVGAADEGRRQDPADIGELLFAGDVAP